MKKVFDLIDTDSDGTLSKVEIQTTLLTASVAATVFRLLRKYPFVQLALQPSNLAGSMLTMDEDGGGEVDVNEWYTWVKGIETKQRENQMRHDCLLKLFAVMDVNHDGNLDRKEIRKSLEKSF